VKLARVAELRSEGGEKGAFLEGEWAVDELAGAVGSISLINSFSPWPEPWHFENEVYKLDFSLI
jgi:hypothetical protein